MRRSSCTDRAMASSVMATTVAAGCPAAISRARFGPVSTPAQMARDHLGDDLGHAQMRALFEPLGQRQHRGARPGGSRDSSLSTARNPCDGTAMTTRALPATASSSDAVARSGSGQGDAGEVVGVLVGAVDALGQRGPASPQHGRRRARRHGGDGRAP